MNLDAVEFLICFGVLLIVHISAMKMYASYVGCFGSGMILVAYLQFSYRLIHAYKQAELLQQ